jgi:pilus assembly protein FimV
MTALLLITASSQLHALGLGEMDMKSTLNQPMDAIIELTSAAGTELSKVNVTLASQAAHQRIGLSRSRVLNNFEFNVKQDSQGKAFIRVTSREDVHEPFLEFLLELTWPNGHLLREYTVLIDPPVTMPAAPVTPVTPISSVSVSPRAVQPQRRQSQPVPAAVRSPMPSTTASADSYGPIRRNETLWSIAERVRPGRDISMHQMMLALQRANPQAFADNNINNLKAGATLKIPSRNEILSVSAADAFAETSKQFSDWKAGVQDAEHDERAQQTAAAVEADTAAESVVATESRLQLVAPDLDAVDGAATSADPVEVMDESTESDEASIDMLNQQLAMATEEAETSKVQTAELQSQVGELEEQLDTMARLLELKDAELASMQEQLAADSAPEMDEPVISEETVTPEEELELVVSEEAESAEATSEEPAVEIASVDEAGVESKGIIDKLMENPLLAGAGVLVALLLGGFLWKSIRQKRQSGIFDDEITLEKHMSSAVEDNKKDSLPPVVNVNIPDAEPEQAQQEVSGYTDNDSDPLTEADVYLAYGRIQQAEDVLQAALAASPDDSSIRLKLLEVYHAAGNVAAFNREASGFHDSIAEEDAVWMQVASMGHALAPDNDLYRAAAIHTANAEVDAGEGLTELNDISDQEQPLDDAANDPPVSDLPESIEFHLDETADVFAAEGDLDEDVSEGLLSTSEEVTTKLDLARAYLDMGDPEGARSILGEVMEEGNVDQKNEAEELIAKLA